MREQRQIRSRSWNRMPTKRCSANSIMNEFIVVDDDDDDVIILDFPQSSKCKASGLSKSILQRVISIDDDDDDDDDDDTENVHKGESSSSHNSLGDNLQTSAEEDSDEDCQFVQEKCAAFRFSKCKHTFSSGNRSGLGSEFESDFLDSDCSDCEILEGSHTEVREQWVKAFLTKMKKSGKVGLSEKPGPSDIPCDPDLGRRNVHHDQTSSFFPARNSNGGKETSSTFFGTDDRTKPSNSRFFSKEDISGPSSLSPEIQVEHERSDSPSTHFPSPKERIHQNSFKEVEKQPDKVQVHYETSQATEENQNKRVGEEEEEASKSSPPQTSDGDEDTTPVLDKQSSGTRCEDVISSLGESRKLIFYPIPSTSGQVKDINATAPAMDIMLGREMLKETDEYKKAQEQEWESRQRQLQIQAEEAQRQRKRRKLENTRQLEMERRQKERLEEVREIQKKDEESMTMKEKVRTEITKSLKLLELKCINMESLLRGLGIHVGGGTFPLPNEVHAAYKRAVLKFHPDRASRGDIKQQVEAEEKFKLIARMKEKFNSTSL